MRERRKIVEIYLTNKYVKRLPRNANIHRIASRFLNGALIVRKYVDIYLETGQLLTFRERWGITNGRPRSYSVFALRTLKGIVQRKNELYLDELQWEVIQREYQHPNPMMPVLFPPVPVVFEL